MAELDLISSQSPFPPYPRTLTRRRLAGAMGAMGATGVLAACAPGQTAQPETTKERAPVTLRDQRGATPGSAVELSDQAIKLKHPWLTVVHEGGGSSSAEAMAKLVVMAASGELPDIIYARAPRSSTTSARRSSSR